MNNRMGTGIPQGPTQRSLLSFMTRSACHHRESPVDRTKAHGGRRSRPEIDAQLISTPDHHADPKIRVGRERRTRPGPSVPGAGVESSRHGSPDRFRASAVRSHRGCRTVFSSLLFIPQTPTAGGYRQDIINFDCRTARQVWSIVQDRVEYRDSGW